MLVRSFKVDSERTEKKIIQSLCEKVENHKNLSSIEFLKLFSPTFLPSLPLSAPPPKTRCATLIGRMVQSCCGWIHPPDHIAISEQWHSAKKFLEAFMVKSRCRNENRRKWWGCGEDGFGEFKLKVERLHRCHESARHITSVLSYLLLSFFTFYWHLGVL